MNTKPLFLGKSCICGEERFQYCNEDGSVPGVQLTTYCNGKETHYYRCMSCERAYTVTLPEDAQDIKLGTWTHIKRPSTRCRECQEAMDNLKESGLCVLCERWVAFSLAKHPSFVRANGRHYIIGDEEGNLVFGMRGFGGERFIVKFHDGRIVKTTNLWAQGVIPERFRDRLPDNAEFVGKAPWV
jgi:hypothetical protein